MDRNEFHNFWTATLSYLNSRGFNVGDYDYWMFIEKYYANYSHSELVMQVDLCDRYLSGELEDKKDIEFVESIGDDNKIIQYRDSLEERLFCLALSDFICGRI